MGPEMPDGKHRRSDLSMCPATFANVSRRGPGWLAAMGALPFLRLQRSP